MPVVRIGLEADGAGRFALPNEIACHRLKIFLVAVAVVIMLTQQAGSLGGGKEGF